MKSEARQKNFQKIRATEPYVILPVYIRGRFVVSFYKDTGEFGARQDKYMVEILKKITNRQKEANTDLRPQEYIKQLMVVDLVDILIWLYLLNTT